MSFDLRNGGRFLSIYADTSYRYSLVGQLLETSSGSILEVGGYSTGYRAVLTSMWSRRPITVNLQRKRTSQPDIVGSLMALPFADASFNHLALIDVLEHIPALERISAVREALRVARERVILLFPFHSEASIAAEHELVDTLQYRGVRIKASLEEHLKFGLPVLEDVLSFPEAAGWKSTIKYVTFRRLLFASLAVQDYVGRDRWRRRIASVCSSMLPYYDRDLARTDAYRVLLTLSPPLRE